MSKPKHYWYDFSRKMIMRYSTLNADIPIEAAFKKAIDETLAEVEKNENAAAHKKALKMLLFDNTHTLSGAALKLHYSERNIQIWINDFVNTVGKRAGFENEKR